MFNSLKYVKQLEDAGVVRAQAEVHLQIMTEIIESNLATKQDLTNLKAVDIQNLAVKIDTLQAAMIHGFVQLEQRMVIKLGVIAAAAVTIAVGVVAFIVKLIASS